MNIDQLLEQLRVEPVHTWFDLGLFVDRLKEDRQVPTACFEGDSRDFLRQISRGVAFVSFDYAIDGVTMEVLKYARALDAVLEDVSIHLVAGCITEEAKHLFDRSYRQSVLECLSSFDEWPLYQMFFEQKLERGGEAYNTLIGAFWRDVLNITETLGRYVEDNDIRLLFLVNTNSNPGNVALALANVLVSEGLGVPVICNNHDFYWEGGASEAEREAQDAAPGPRDHFFTNAHLGEVFSLIQMIFPWESRSWIGANINHLQSVQLIGALGHNPANVTEIGTAVDTERRFERNPRKRIQALTQLAEILAKPGQDLEVEPVQEVIQNGSLARNRRRPMLVGWQRGPVEFARDNMVLLQPTRIIVRKQLEVNLELIRRLFEHPDFAGYFDENQQLKLTLMVTGPVATGHDPYLDQLLVALARMLEQVDIAHRHRIHCAFLFSGFDSPAFKTQHENPIDIAGIYNLASMTLLPSETEGRGLPILESAAYGVPIFVRRYTPQEVYARVTGEHLPRAERLLVIETRGSPIEQPVVDAVCRTLVSLPRSDDARAHNQRAVRERFSNSSLRSSMEELLEKLRRQMQPNVAPRELAVAALGDFETLITAQPDAFAKIVHTVNRQYLPGYGQMEFMIYLKSLIDPSFFRVEEQQIRGMAMRFATWLAQSAATAQLSAARQHLFYNSVDSLFGYREGQGAIRHDHSLAYRHRNTHHYPYRDLTPQELTGVINLLHHSIAGVRPAPSRAHRPPRAFTNWFGMVAQLCGSPRLSIDHREELARKLNDNVPLIYFTGKAVLQELELFVVQPVRQRLGLAASEELTSEHLDSGPTMAPVYLFKRKAPLGDHLTAVTLRELIEQDGNSELRLLYHRGVCRVVDTEQLSQGVDFRQVGRRALEITDQVRERHGFVVANNPHAAMMTDIVDLDRFHIGLVVSPLDAQIMGIPEQSGYVQWVPAGLRFTLAYPTPVQTAADFSRALKGELYQDRCRQLGEETVLRALKQDAQENGTPIAAVLERMGTERTLEGAAAYSSTNGLYEDGLPWAGVIATVDNSPRPPRFRIMCSEDGPQTVQKIVEAFERDSGRNAWIAWNGGYILNTELVGKLGIQESYIGSPLGLIISEGRVVCPPLFNKPALLVHSDGRVEIKRVSCATGIRLRAATHDVVFDAAHHNPEAPGAEPVFYDLMFPRSVIPGDGRVICRLAGNRIMTICRTRRGEDVPVLPVGLTLSFPPESYPQEWQVGQDLEIQLESWPALSQAIEAGPLLVDQGRICLDMEEEGWKTDNSIHTQAARLDYTDMRGPKIAVGLDEKSRIVVLAINGRIRESVGATHRDMACILLSRNVVTAMGFDPGGSSTLVVGDRVLNVPPYNRDYERNIYALPPRSRAVTNAVVLS
jgi:hypothetical protein